MLKTKSSRRRGLLSKLRLLGLGVLLAAAPSLLAQDPHQGHVHPPSDTRPQGLDGLRIPDVPVIDQDGGSIHFFTDLVKGKLVAINFVFTTCTTVCPPMGANFARLQKLASAPGNPEVHLISVSVDPVTDTPERLKAWRGRFGVHSGWTLVTGEKSDVDNLLKALGIFTADKWDHSPIALIGDEPSGRWTRAYGLAPPDQLLEIIHQTAHGDEQP